MLSSSRTQTGQYIIFYYDRYGGKLKYKNHARSFTEAGKKAEDFLLATPEASSYTIDRRLFNSLDPEATL
jgi:hypothetical protein